MKLFDPYNDKERHSAFSKSYPADWEFTYCHQGPISSVTALLCSLSAHSWLWLLGSDSFHSSFLLPTPTPHFALPALFPSNPSPLWSPHLMQVDNVLVLVPSNPSLLPSISILLLLSVQRVTVRNICNLNSAWWQIKDSIWLQKEGPRFYHKTLTFIFQCICVYN